MRIIVIAMLFVFGFATVLHSSKNEYNNVTDPKIMTSFVIRVNGGVEYVAEDIVYNTIYYSNMYNIDPLITLMLIKVESDFRHDCISEKGAKGLMQIMHRVWGDELREKNIIAERKDLFNIKNNIHAGVYILSKYIKRAGDTHTAINWYNGRNTTNHAEKVYSILKKYNAYAKNMRI
jgi:soluble lytic murein transglycosylase-like protein